MDSLLTGLFGDTDNDSKRTQAQDFINRYEDGLPQDNISDDEAVTNFQAVAGQLSPEQFQESATEAYERLSPEERNQFAQWLKERGGADAEGLTGDDPRQLAQVTSRLQADQPDGLAGLLGGGGLGSMLGGGGGGIGGLLGGNGNSGGGIGGMLSGVLGGDQDNQRNQNANQGGGMGDMLQSPIGRAVLGGIAAIAMKKFMR
ncbi:MAG TPA: hypothetical protein VEW66_01280 [Thermomicrobiales bacterium]|nr:hypothetical protein [Thermomicrobiales bacterium]